MILVSIMLNAARRFLNPAQGERHDNLLYSLIKRVWKCFTIQIIPATFFGLGIMVD